MADTCIVCLGDLRLTIDGDPPPDIDTVLTAAAEHNTESDDAKQALRSHIKSLEADEETIAHLLPCKHDLHNSCLKPWVERANSCPICRAAFNMVELSHTVGGPVLDSYAVKDKTQEAEVDPTMIVEDELFAVETWEPCTICSVADDTHEKMYCDGCEKAVHVFCAGYDDSPEVWYCETCLAELETEVALPGVASALGRPTRGRGRNSRRRGRGTNDAIWARVWQEVSRRLDLDLDFPFDEEPDRTEEQRREFRRWEERLQVARTQGATARLRGIAAAQLNREPHVQPAPESQDEIRAWNAFDKARESQEAPASLRRRKRRATASPASPHESEATEQPQLKRPRLRRPPAVATETTTAESSASAARNADDRGTFLSSLLHDVETKPTSASSPAGTDQANGAFSPRNSSPVRSPVSSGHATPRQLSVTPPPQRPQSPLLSSTIVPLESPVAARFSPFSPDAKTQVASPNQRNGHRGRRRHDSGDEGSRGPSPSRTLSYSSKEEIQRMVKMALKPRYREKQIDKDQYTDINRDVSRKLYDMVGDASALADEAGREKWQQTAEAEVQKAVAALPTPSTEEDGDALERELEKEMIA